MSSRALAVKSQKKEIMTDLKFQDSDDQLKWPGVIGLAVLAVTVLVVVGLCAYVIIDKLSHGG
jgi:hypothetical protein